MPCCAPPRRARRANAFMCRSAPMAPGCAPRAMPPWPRWMRSLIPRQRPLACAARMSSLAMRSSPCNRSDSMANVTVIGAQWGDEGKGKVVDWLASRAEIVVRFQGGHNAGHTLVVGNQTYKLSLLPSGLVRGKLGIIGNGVVVDPEALLAEMERVRAQGLTVTPETLRVAENAVLILPLHPAIDKAREDARGALRIGTTGRGIGPAYEDKVAR